MPTIQAELIGVPPPQVAHHVADVERGEEDDTDPTDVVMVTGVGYGQASCRHRTRRRRACRARVCGDDAGEAKITGDDAA